MVSLARQTANVSTGGELPPGEYAASSSAFAFMSPVMEKLAQLERNLIINGNFDFWQRGTSVTNRAAGDTNFLADRFKLTLVGTSAIYRMDRSADVPTAAQSGFQSSYSLAIQCTTADAAVAAGDLVILRTSLEGLDYSNIASGKSFRLQFWAKSVLAGTYCVSFMNDANNRNYIKEYVLAANTWTKVTIDLNSDTVGTWALDNTAGIQVCWALMAGSTFSGSTNTWQGGNLRASSNQVNFSSSTSNIFYLSQVMLVPGDLLDSSMDLQFRRAGRSIQDELSMCQRYYEKSYDLSVAPGNVNGSGVITSVIAPSGDFYVGINYKISKRAVTHTTTIYNPGNGNVNSLQTYKNGGPLANVSTSGVATQENQSYFGVAGNAAGDRVYVQYHYTAEAEL